MLVDQEQRKSSNIAQVIDYFVGVADAIVRAKVNMDKIDFDVVLDSEQMKDAILEDMQVATRNFDVLRNTLSMEIELELFPERRHRWLARARIR